MSKNDLTLTREERERIGYILRDAAADTDDFDGDSDAPLSDDVWALAAKVDPWHDRDGNEVE